MDAVVVDRMTGGIPMIDDVLTVNPPSFPSTIAFIAEMISSSATSVLNFKIKSKMRLPQLQH